LLTMKVNKNLGRWEWLDANRKISITKQW